MKIRMNSVQASHHTLWKYLIKKTIVLYITFFNFIPMICFSLNKMYKFLDILELHSYAIGVSFIYIYFFKIEPCV